MQRENYHQELSDNTIKSNLRNSKKYPLNKKQKQTKQSVNPQKITNFDCDKEGHENIQAGIICMDPNCISDRILCFKCYHERHLQHCCMTISDFHQHLNSFLQNHENLSNEKIFNLSQSKLAIQRKELNANLQRKFNQFLQFFQTTTQDQQQKINQLIPLDVINTLTQSKNLPELKIKIEKILNVSAISLLPNTQTPHDQIVHEYMLTQFKQYDDECKKMQQQNEQLQEIINSEFNTIFQKIGNILNQQYEESKIEVSINFQEESKSDLNLDLQKFDYETNLSPKLNSPLKKSRSRPRKYKKRIRFSRSPQSHPKTQESQPKVQSELLNNGIKEFKSGNFEKAKESINQYLETMNKNSGQENEILKAKGFYYIGCIEKKLHHSDNSIQNLRTALNKYKKLLGNDTLEVANTHFMLGNVYKKLNNFKEAGQYHQKALEIRKKLEFQELIAESYYQIGKIYKRKGEPQQALQFHEQALLLLPERFRKSSNGDFKQAKIQQVITLGETFFANGKLYDAEKILTKAKELFIEGQQSTELNKINQLLSDIQQKLSEN